jgi:hypothetical protein
MAALASLMAQIGPKLNDFAGAYEMHPGPPPPLTAESELQVLDRDRIQWTATLKGASAVYVRDQRNPTWFVGEDGSSGGCCNSTYDNTGDVWVLENPGKPVAFRPKAAADNKTAPTVTAMMRDVPDEYQKRTVAGSGAGASDGFGISQKALDRLSKQTPEMQAREEAKFQKQQSHDAEMMLIKEGISNDRAQNPNKQEWKKESKKKAPVEAGAYFLRA